MPLADSIRLSSNSEKSPRAHQRGGNRQVVRRRRDILAVRLVVAEGEELVLEDRSANGEAGLVAFEGSRRPASPERR
jgi:hypothetical protein